MSATKAEDRQRLTVLDLYMNSRVGTGDVNPGTATFVDHGHPFEE